MLPLYGRDYVIDHIVSSFQHEQEELSYKIYVADVLKLICENTAKGSGGSYLSRRWIDIIENGIDDGRSGDEIALDIIGRANLKLSGGEENG